MVPKRMTAEADRLLAKRGDLRLTTSWPRSPPIARSGGRAGFLDTLKGAVRVLRRLVELGRAKGPASARPFARHPLRLGD